MRLTPPRFIGVSLKTYFGLQATLEWCGELVDRLGSHRALADGLAEFVVFPATPFISHVGTILAGTEIQLGAQDVSELAGGAFTGESLATHVHEAGARFAEIGHAERRKYKGEQGGVIAQKFHHALAAGLSPLLCVGEMEHGEPSRGVEVCRAQIEEAVSLVPAGEALKRLVVAYEPVWAIGADRPAPESYVLAVHDGLRSVLDSDIGAKLARVVYGGSAGPGLLTRVSPPLDGLFLGRFAHSIDNVESILNEALLG